MTIGRPVRVAGVGVAIPGVRSALALLEGLHSPAAEAPVDVETTLGRRGLRYKDQATKMALCAAAYALQDAGVPIPLPDQASADSFGVVATSNLSNLDTVCRVADTIHEEGVESTSPMELPNASSNIVASSVAIRFGLRGPNLMICNGATSGVDALHVAAIAIRACRADRVVVVGVETVNETVARLMRESAARHTSSHQNGRLLDGAAAVLLEAAAGGRERQRHPGPLVGGYAYGESARESIVDCGGHTAPPGLWLTPNLGHRGVPEQVDGASALWSDPVRRCDLSAALGECYGALGVIQCAAACAWLRSRPDDHALITSGGCYGDGYASLLLQGEGRRASASPARASAAPVEAGR